MKKMLLMIGLMILFCVKTGFCFTEIGFSWQPNTESALVGYNVYVCSTYQKALSLTADVAFFTVPAVSQPSFCYTLSKHYKLIFVVLTATDSIGNESERSDIGYILEGNIYGDFNQGFSYLNAKVDGMDLSTISIYFGSFTTHQNIDCQGYFEVKDTTLQQDSDLNGDGRIDGYDMNILAPRFGNTAY